MRLSSTNAQLHNELCCFLNELFLIIQRLRYQIWQGGREQSTARAEKLFLKRAKIFFSPLEVQKVRKNQKVNRFPRDELSKILCSQFHLAGITNVINWFWDLINSTIFFLTQPVPDASEMQSNWFPCVYICTKLVCVKTSSTTWPAGWSPTLDTP